MLSVAVMNAQFPSVKTHLRKKDGRATATERPVSADQAALP